LQRREESVRVRLCFAQVETDEKRTCANGRTDGRLVQCKRNDSRDSLVVFRRVRVSAEEFVGVMGVVDFG
jgi:hypothetical protein